MTQGLNYILQDLFRDTPLDHIWRAQIRTPNTVFGVFGCIGPYLAVFGCISSEMPKQMLARDLDAHKVADVAKEKGLKRGSTCFIQSLFYPVLFFVAAQT